MRKLKKKLAALGVGLAVMTASVVSMSASAGLIPEATWYPWGPQYWTPDTGSFFANPRMVDVWNLKWSRQDLEAIAAEQRAQGK